MSELIQAYINGQWENGTGGTAEYRSAYDGSRLGTFSVCQAGDVERAISAARSAQAGWAATPLLDKVDLMYSAYELCKAANEEIAQSIRERWARLSASHEKRCCNTAWGISGVRLRTCFVFVA
jgi:acyl-CoA reductase-like NAD-dependent aldehyde dehydrogenase